MGDFLATGLAFGDFLATRLGEDEEDDVEEDDEDDDEDDEEDEEDWTRFLPFFLGFFRCSGSDEEEELVVKLCDGLDEDERTGDLSRFLPISPTIEQL